MRASPQWSLGGLRALIGFVCVEAPDALGALLAREPGRGPACCCELLFESLEAALASPSWRRGLDGLLAGLLAPDAATLSHRTLYELASLYAAEVDSLPPRTRLALLWLLGRHPCFAARRLEERVARDLAHSSSEKGPWYEAETRSTT